MSQGTMTASSAIPEVLTTRLRKLRGKVSRWLAIYGLSRWFLWLLGLFAADLLIDWLFHMDKAQRSVMLVLAIAVLATVAYRRLVRPLTSPISDDALCLEVENRHRQLGQSLISALQFSRMSKPTVGISRSFIQATIEQGTRAVEQVAFESVLNSRRFVYNSLLLLILLLTCGGLALSIVWTEPLGIWFNRNILLGDQSWPQDTYLVVQGAESGRLRIPRGDDWPLTVTAAEESRVIPEEVEIEIRTNGSQRTEALERDASTGIFSTTLNNVIEEMQLRAVSGRSYTPWIEVELVDRPATEKLQLAVTAPAYTGGKTEKLPPGKGPYYILKGSRLSVRGTSTKKLSSAILAAPGVRKEMTLSEKNHFEIVLDPADLSSASYQIELTDTEEMLLPYRDEPGPLGSRNPSRFSLKVKPDRPPQLQVHLRGIGSMIVPGARIPMDIQVEDDYAVNGLRLLYEWVEDSEERQDIHGKIEIELPKEAGVEKDFSLLHVFQLSPLKIPQNSRLTVLIEADDNDNISGPKSGKSSTVVLRVVSEDQVRGDLLRREKEIRLDFEKLLKIQEDILTESQALRAETQQSPTFSDSQRGSLAKTQKRQKLIGTRLIAINQRLEMIVLEIQNNYLEEQNGPLQTRLTQQIIDPIWGLIDGSIPAAAKNLGEARRLADRSSQRNTTLDRAIELQEQTARTMRKILTHMIKTEGYQEAINMLYQIQQSQQQVLKMTDKEKQQRIQRILNQQGSEKKP